MTTSNEMKKRLIKDVKRIIKEPLTHHGIYYAHDDQSFLTGYAMIVGPENTPYFGGYYFFKFTFPEDYPFSPPTVTYMTNDGTTRFNPNLYKSGKVCVSILNTWAGDKWSACQTITSILLTICSLLNNEPLLNEPGLTKTSRGFLEYQKSIEYMNIKFAICDMMDVTNSSIPEPFTIFYSFMKEHFIKNYDKILEFVNLNENLIEQLRVDIYSMNTHVNYPTLKQRLEFIMNQFNETCK